MTLAAHVFAMIGSFSYVSLHVYMGVIVLVDNDECLGGVMYTVYACIWLRIYEQGKQASPTPTRKRALLNGR